MPAAALLLSFGFHVPTQRLIAIEEISEAQRGAACACVCPGCKSVLFAKFPRSLNGPTRHFAHAPGVNCVAPETLLHKTAKILVTQERRLWLPARPGKLAHLQEFDAGVHEHPFGPPPPNDYAADAMLTLQGRQLLVEIVVTHDLDERKHGYVIENKLHLVRIDLSEFPRVFTLADLRQRVVAPPPGLDRWVYPEPEPAPDKPRSAPYPIRLGQTIERAVVWRRNERTGVLEPRVSECQLGLCHWHHSSGANAAVDCLNCPGRNTDFGHRHPFNQVFCCALGYDLRL